MTSDKTNNHMKDLKEDLILIKDKNDKCETFAETLIQKSENLMQRHLSLLKEHEQKKHELRMKQKILEHKARSNSKNYTKEVRTRSKQTRDLFAKLSNKSKSQKS